MPKSSQPLVVLIVYDGLLLFEFGCAFEVFGLTRPEMGSNWYRCLTAAAEPGPLRGTGGIEVHADGGLELLRDADTILIPGWKAPTAKAPAPLLEALRAAHTRGCRIVSICGGAFVLAQSGLLRGKRATTHWHHLAWFASTYPEIEVEQQALYVEDTGLLTSAGSAAGLDLCLHVVRQDFGAKAANSVARRLVIPAHRDGGQSQFVERPVPPSSGKGISALLDTIRTCPGDQWTIDRMAREARISVRSVHRRIRAATGLAPGAWLQRVRLDYARDLLEETKRPIKVIASDSGFGTATNFRKHFLTAFGLPPSSYRSRFRSNTSD
ncbi:transcriptional regulator FtrA [Rhodospirillum sp. A1_3_36]|uniref:transcriptional regulator FtrA n=1 Tax=Rhodospirillum sp. A1_3_36 TaxID=3391666 RepID=UPI0039A6C6BB